MCPAPSEFSAPSESIKVAQHYENKPLSIIIRNGHQNRWKRASARVTTPKADCTFASGYEPDGCGFVNPIAPQADLSMENCFQACLDQPNDCKFGVQYKPSRGPGHPNGNCDLIPQQCPAGLASFKRCEANSISVHCKYGGWMIISKEVFTSDACADAKIVSRQQWPARQPHQVKVQVYLDMSTEKSRQLILHGLFDVMMEKPMIEPYIDLTLLPIVADHDIAPQGSASRQANQLLACVLEHVGDAKQVFSALHCQEAVNARRLGDTWYQIPRCFDSLLDASKLHKIMLCERSSEGEKLLRISRWGIPLTGATEATELPWVVVDGQPVPCKDGKCKLLKPICNQLAAKDVHLSACHSLDY
jgi:hypothetical protein